MSSKDNPPLPPTPHVLLLVEGGDERTLCREVVGQSRWTQLHCWLAHGLSNLPALASLAFNDPNFGQATSIGIVVDAEQSVALAQSLALAALGNMGITANTVTHAVVAAAQPRIGIFVSPNGLSTGSIETLCKQAVPAGYVRNCVDGYFNCINATYSTDARRDKAWLRAYLASLPDPSLRWDQVVGPGKPIDSSSNAFDGLRTFLNSL
jgi:hypothetical protein